VTGDKLALGAVAALAALGLAKRRGGRNEDWTYEPFDGFRVEGGVPAWVFRVRYGRGMMFPRLYTLDGKLLRDQAPSQVMRQRMGLRQDPEDAQLIQDWLEQHREWSDYLLSLPIDWSKPLYARKGAWGDASRVFLDDEEAISESHGFVQRVSERRFESGISVLASGPGGDGWEVVKPSSRQAIYGLPHDYLSSWLEMDRPVFILQGDRVVAEENYYTDDGEGPFTLYEYGADGEPLLIADTITVVDEPSPDRMSAA
jgi:hypothetical protein